MNFLKYIKKGKAREPKPLRIEGCHTVLTPEPDDAELAAQALLESLSSPDGRKKADAKEGKDKPGKGTPEYYRSLSDRIREAHEAEAHMAMRYVAYCEQELPKADAGKLNELERGLYRYTDIVERERGDLKARWQHALAEVLVKQMNTAGDEAKEGEE